MMLRSQVRVVLVDDHLMVRDGLKEVLESSGEFEVVGEAGDGATAIQVSVETRPDVVVMDLRLPVMNGVDACREIVRLLPETRVLALTAFTGRDTALDALTAGAVGYLEKVYGSDELVSSVRAVAKGEYRMSSDILHWVLDRIRSTPDGMASGGLSLLTARERSVLDLYAAGRSYSEIGQATGRRAVTVRNVIYGIRDKLGLDTTHALTIWALEHGLPDPQPATDS